MEARAISGTRRALLACLGAVAVNVVTAFFMRDAWANDIGQAQGAAPGSEHDYGELVAAGEAALARGEAEKAADLFELAGGMRHAAPSELGLVRAWLQLGQYRRALAFLAHAAGVHLDAPEGGALYAWLLHLGGQREFAKRTLDKAMALHPGNTFLASAAAHIAAPGRPLPPELLTPPARFAPYAIGAILDTAVSVGTALRLSATQTLAPQLAVENATGLWLRDAQGHTAKAEIAAKFDDLGFVMLQTANGLLNEPPKAPWATRPAFPGSAGFAMEYLAMATNQPSWPMLQTGFIGRHAQGHSYNLGIPVLSQGTPCGPVLDRAGNIVGVAIRAANGQNWLVSVSGLRASLPAATFSAETGNTQLPNDEIYERALGLSAQLLVYRLT